MEDLMNVASYIYNRYESENGIKIDEMKLHKLMYFSQRESLNNNKMLSIPDKIIECMFVPFKA